MVIVRFQLTIVVVQELIVILQLICLWLVWYSSWHIVHIIVKTNMNPNYCNHILNSIELFFKIQFQAKIRNFKNELVTHTTG